MLDRLEKLLEWGGTRRKVALLSVSGLALLMSMLGMEPLPFEISWIAIVLCGVPIVLEAVLGLATAWDIKADVLVSVALVASVIIGEDFAAAEIAFIMQLGELLEELTVARARKGIERLVRLTPATAGRRLFRRKRFVSGMFSAYCPERRFRRTALFFPGTLPSTSP